jgi:hypothetical protein
MSKQIKKLEIAKSGKTKQSDLVKKVAPSHAPRKKEKFPAPKRVVRKTK